MQADSAIEHRESALRLLDVEIRTGVEAAHVAAIDVEQSTQARVADGRRPGQRARYSPQRCVRDAPTGKLEQGVRERPAAGSDKIVAVLGVGHGHARVPLQIGERTCERLQLKSLADNAAAQVARAGPREWAVVLVRAIEALAAAVDRFHDEIQAVEGVQLEVAEDLVEQGQVHVDPAAIVLGADFERVIDLRFEPQVAARGDEAAAIRLRCRDADRAIARQREWLGPQSWI